MDSLFKKKQTNQLLISLIFSITFFPILLTYTLTFIISFLWLTLFNLLLRSSFLNWKLRSLI